MAEGDRIVSGVAKEPSHKIVAKWLIQVYKSILEEIGQNSWKQKGYEQVQMSIWYRSLSLELIINFNYLLVNFLNNLVICVTMVAVV